MAKLVPDDIWQYIGFKLPTADRIRFRAVCKTWMSLLPSCHPPWLLLGESEEAAAEVEIGPIVPPPRGFVSLGEELPYRIYFPEIHHALCLGSTGNWLITAHKDKSIRLLNPFSARYQLQLPSQLELDRGVDYHGNLELGGILLCKVILSSPPSVGGNPIAMAIHGAKKILSIARLGDEKWTRVQISNPPAPCMVRSFLWCGRETRSLTRPESVSADVDDAVFYQGHFHAVTNRGELLVCDLGNAMNPPKASYLSGPVEEFSLFRIKYLVESLGELLMAVKCVDGLKFRTSRFEIYKFDFVDKKWDVLKCLGERSLFLGFNTSVSVCASDYFGLVKQNCVYFTDDFLFGYLHTEGGHDMGVFYLEDTSITPLFTGVSTSQYSPSVWIVPT